MIFHVELIWSGGDIGIRIAVKETLVKSGTHILRNPEKFRDAVIASLDQDSKETKALRVGCDEEFVTVFSVAVAEGTPDALGQASVQAATHLIDDYAMDAVMSKHVSEEVSAGCADFLGVGHKESDEEVTEKVRSAHRGGKHSGIRSLAMPVIVFVVLAGAAVAVLSHFVPFLGCTVLPNTGTIDGVEYSWYKATSDVGTECTILFLRNAGDDFAYVTSKRGTVTTDSPIVRIPPRGEGLAVLNGGNGLENVEVQRNSGTSWAIPSEQLVWHLENRNSSDDPDQKDIVIENIGDDDMEWIDDFTIASEGVTAGSHSITGMRRLRVGEIHISTGKMQNGVSVGDDISITDDCELFVNGVKVPHA